MTFSQLKALVNSMDESKIGSHEVVVSTGAVVKSIAPAAGYQIKDISTTTGLRTGTINRPPRVCIEI